MFHCGTGQGWVEGGCFSCMWQMRNQSPRSKLGGKTVKLCEDTQGIADSERIYKSIPGL